MPFVATLARESFPIVAYQEDTDGRPILDTVIVVGVAPSNEGTKSKITVQGNYEILRSELLTPGKYNPKKSKLEVDEANRLREYLIAEFKVEGLEGVLR
jgi:hypothetical protein